MFFFHSCRSWIPVIRSNVLLGPAEGGEKEGDDGGDFEEAEEPVVGPGFAQEVAEVDEKVDGRGGEVEDSAQAGGKEGGEGDHEGWDGHEEGRGEEARGGDIQKTHLAAQDRLDRAGTEESEEIAVQVEKHEGDPQGNGRKPRIRLEFNKGRFGCHIGLLAEEHTEGRGKKSLIKVKKDPKDDGGSYSRTQA